MGNESGSLVAERTLKILLLFENHSELTLSQITQMIEISKTSAYRLVTTLTEHGFLLKDNEKKYRLGPVLPLLVKNMNSDLQNIAQPFLENISETIGESVYISVLTEPDKYMFIAGIDSPHPLKYTVNLYNHIPIDAGSAAKAHLAFQSKDIEKTIDSLEMIPYTQDTMIEKSKLLEEILKIKENGYSLSKGERYEEVVGISVPIMDMFKVTKAVLTIFIPKSRSTDELLNLYIKIMKNVANEIAKRMS